MFQFYVEGGKLSCQMYQRSADLFLGLPFNIASTALLTQILATVLHIDISEICLSICDAHIYQEHVQQIDKQVSQDPYELPQLIIKKFPPPIDISIDEKINWIESLKYEDFELKDYLSHPALPAIMK